MSWGVTETPQTWTSAELWTVERRGGEKAEKQEKEKKGTKPSWDRQHTRSSPSGREHVPLSPPCSPGYEEPDVPSPGREHGQRQLWGTLPYASLRSLTDSEEQGSSPSLGVSRACHAWTLTVLVLCRGKMRLRPSSAFLTA